MPKTTGADPRPRRKLPASRMARHQDDDDDALSNASFDDSPVTASESESTTTDDPLSQVSSTDEDREDDEDREEDEDWHDNINTRINTTRRARQQNFDVVGPWPWLGLASVLVGLVAAAMGVRVLHRQPGYGWPRRPEPVPISQAAVVAPVPAGAGGDDGPIVIQAVVSPLLDRIESILVDFVTVAPPTLLYLDLEARKTGTALPVSADQVLQETSEHLQRACDLGSHVYLYKDKGPNQDAMRRAGDQLKQQCARLSDVAFDLGRRMVLLNQTLGCIGGSDYDVWGSAASNYLPGVLMGLGERSTGGCTAASGQNANEYRRCSGILLASLNITASWEASGPFRMGHHLTTVQDHVEHLVTGLHRLRGAVPAIDAASSVLKQHPRVVNAWKNLQAEPSWWSGTWSTNADTDHALLRESSASAALVHLDRAALEPLLQKFALFQQQLSDRVVKPLNDFRESVRALLTHDPPSLVFASASAQGSSHKIMVIGPLRLDSVWVTEVLPHDNNNNEPQPQLRLFFVTYLPSIPEAVERLSRARDAVAAASDRRAAKINEVCFFFFSSFLLFSPLADRAFLPDHTAHFNLW